MPDLAYVVHGALRALAAAGVFSKQGTGLTDGTALETTAHDRGGGQATRKVRLEENPEPRQAMEVSVSGGTGLRLLEAVPTIPLAVKGGADSGA